jgi:hypothetical protein
MAIPSRQIGWGTKANLLWQISKQLEQLIGVTSKLVTYTTTTSTTTATPALRLLFDSITNANLLVGDASNVTDWNTFFDLPTLGYPFTSLNVVGNEVELIGGSNIKVKPGLMYEQGYQYLTSVIDTGCITSVGGDAFSYCELLTDVDLPECTIVYGYEDSPNTDYGGFGECINLVNVNIPKLITAGAFAFSNCYSLVSINFPYLTTAERACFLGSVALTTINTPLLNNIDQDCFIGCTSLVTIPLLSCTNLGGTVGNNQVFTGITGNTITLTIPASRMTCNGGLPDGDIVYLQANNTVTIVTV